MMRTRALVMPAETVTQVATLRRRARRLFTVPSVRRRVNPYSVFVDVRAVLNKLRIAGRGRGCVCMNCQGRNQGHRQDDLCENFHVDYPCLHQCRASELYLSSGFVDATELAASAFLIPLELLRTAGLAALGGEWKRSSW